MAVLSCASKRIRVHLHGGNVDSATIEIPFIHSLLESFGCKNDCANVYCLMKGEKLILSAKKLHGFEGPMKMTRPSFCPIHNMTKSINDSIPADILSRGVDCGSVALVESSDGFILLIRRAKNLRTFPNIWVPPGGHIEQNETLITAALRECREETGLDLTEEMCTNTKCSILTMWESVFPPLLSAGSPKRHHAVVYVHVPLKQPYTKDYLQSRINLDPIESGACVWLDRNVISAIVDTSVYGEHIVDVAKLKEKHQLKDTFIASVVDSDSGSTTNEDLPMSVLLNEAPPSEQDIERVSTGTKYALSEWLRLKH